MPSRAEAIAARVTAVLQAGPTDAGANVFRDRQDAFTRDEPKAYLVELIDEDTKPLGGGHPAIGGTDQDTVRVMVMACVRSANWQTVADTLRCQAHALLAADPTLRGLVANWRRDRCEWKAANADVPFGYAGQIYQGITVSRASALDLPPP